MGERVRSRCGAVKERVRRRGGNSIVHREVFYIILIWFFAIGRQWKTQNTSYNMKPYSKRGSRDMVDLSYEFFENFWNFYC